MQRSVSEVPCRAGAVVDPIDWSAVSAYLWAWAGRRATVDAEDVVQEVLERMLAKERAGQVIRDAIALARRIRRDVVCDRRRRKARAPVPESCLPPSLPPSLSPFLRVNRS